MPTPTDPCQQAQQALKEAIENLYSVFARYELNDHVDGCPHCVHEEDHARIHSKPLRELSSDDLSKYKRKALSTWGDELDLKHFLPRLFELEALEGLGLVSSEILFRKLNYRPLFNGWQSWSEVEQNSIQDYFRTAWLYIILQKSHLKTEEFLCGIAQAVDNLTPYLEDWANTIYTNSLSNLKEFIDSQIFHGFPSTRKLSNPFWYRRQDQMHQVIAWLLSPTTLQTFQNHRTSGLDESTRQALEEVISLLTQLHEDSP